MENWPPLQTSAPEFDPTQWREQTDRAARSLTRALVALSFVIGGLFSLLLTLVAGF